MKRVYKALVVGEITPLSGAEIFRGKRHCDESTC